MWLLVLTTYEAGMLFEVDKAYEAGVDFVAYTGAELQTVSWWTQVSVMVTVEGPEAM